LGPKVDVVDHRETGDLRERFAGEANARVA
jgi:hypothetical protein